MRIPRVLWNILATFLATALLSTKSVRADPCDEFADTIEPCTCAGAVLDCSAITSGSQLYEIPGIASGQSLAFTSIVVSGNDAVEDLPVKAFGNHFATKSYVITNNSRLKTIAGSAFNAPLSGRTLEEFNASFNALESFPFQEFQECQMLKKAVFSNNKIEVLPPSAFEGLASLESINLGTNMINSIGANAFLGLPAIQDIDLRFNQITNLPAGSLAFTERPGSVLLPANAIASFEDGWTNLLPTQLTLASNRVATLEQSIWEPLLEDYANDALEERFLDFGGNTILCDCQMKWLYDRKEWEPFFQGSLRCDGATPQEQNLWSKDESIFADC